MIEMSFFNLKLDSWSSIKTDPVKIKVTGDNVESDNLTGLTKKEIELLSEDIRFIKTNSSEMNTIENKLSVQLFILFLVCNYIFSAGIFKKDYENKFI
ncbi:hypothetical protein CM15mP43_13100 [bacterium]|nr:MAG: hypothetical protein CM15mP43_13100 [bacterium]